MIYHTLSAAKGGLEIEITGRSERNTGAGAALSVVAVLAAIPARAEPPELRTVAGC